MQNEPVSRRDFRLRHADSRDLPRLKAYFDGLSDGARRDRFHGPIKYIRDSLIASMLSRAQCVVIAEDARDGSIVGEAFMAVEPNAGKAETGLSVAEEWRGRGLGNVLLRELEKRAKTLGARLIYGDVMRGNVRMFSLARRRQYEIVRTPGDWSLSRVRKTLENWMESGRGA